MTVLAWVLSCIATFFVGYHYRELKVALASLRVSLEKKKDVPTQNEGKSVFIDPLDPIQQAKYEHERMMKELNPND